jgi:hypothetical protein
VSPTVFVLVVLAVLMAQRLVDLYAGGHYVCPSCGARSDDRHARDCPWSGTPSGA